MRYMLTQIINYKSLREFHKAMGDIYVCKD